MISIFTEGIAQKPKKGNPPPPSLTKSGKEDGCLITEYHAAVKCQITKTHSLLYKVVLLLLLLWLVLVVRRLSGGPSLASREYY